MKVLKKEKRVNGEARQQLVFESPLSYFLESEAKEVVASGEAEVRLETESLSISPKLGEALYISLRDILSITEADYRIYLFLSSKEKLTLFDLGYKYEDFLRVLTKLCNELMLKDMLMEESLKKSGVQAEFSHFDESGAEMSKGKGELRVYKTALVVMPEKGDLKRVIFSDITEVKAEDYLLTITTDFGEKFTFLQLGKEFDPLVKTLSDAMNELALKVQSMLKELLPQADPFAIRQLSRFMKEGRAAKRSDIEAVSSEIWVELEKKLGALGIKEEYDFLGSLANKERMAIGIKKGLMGELTGEYIWFLIPIYSMDFNEPGNAVAMEATSSEGGGKATYFFRIVDSEDYPNFKNLEDLDLEVDKFIKRINRCMLAINFRREPIYLPDEKLNEPGYQKYWHAIQKLPALRELRHLFIGRVIHSSPEQWKSDVMELLKANAGRSCGAE